MFTNTGQKSLLPLQFVLPFISMSESISLTHIIHCNFPDFAESLLHDRSYLEEFIQVLFQVFDEIRGPTVWAGPTL